MSHIENICICPIQPATLPTTDVKNIVYTKRQLDGEFTIRRSNRRSCTFRRRYALYLPTRKIMNPKIGEKSYDFLQ